MCQIPYHLLTLGAAPTAVTVTVLGTSKHIRNDIVFDEHLKINVYRFIHCARYTDTVHTTREKRNEGIRMALMNSLNFVPRVGCVYVMLKVPEGI